MLALLGGKGGRRSQAKRATSHIKTGGGALRPGYAYPNERAGSLERGRGGQGTYFFNLILPIITFFKGLHLTEL